MKKKDIKTTVRLEAAIQKLYKAFSENTLHPDCCKRCAVGTILDGSDAWRHLSDHHGSLKLNYVGLVHQRIGRRFKGYTPLELLQIEAAFLRGCGYQLPVRYTHFQPDNPIAASVLFDGLCDVVKELCALDHVNDSMDISQLMERSYRALATNPA